MENSHLKSSQQNQSQTSKPTHYRDSEIGTKHQLTSQRKVVSKNKIIITHAQLREATWLFKQYNLKKPGWLRRRFVVNQRRRKLLNDVLSEASLDQSLCKVSIAKDWSGLLHALWHQINEVPPCK